MSAASGGLARSEEGYCSVPPPPWASYPESQATFPAAVTSHYAVGLHKCVACLETELYLSALTLQLSLRAWSLLSPHLDPFVQVGLT